MRCLKRWICDAKAAALEDKYETTQRLIEVAGAGPGGQRGATQPSSAADLPPHLGTSNKPLPGPGTRTYWPFHHPR